MKLFKFVRRFFAAIAMLAAILALWAFWLEPDSLRVTATDLRLRDAAAPLAGMRIAAISDLHAGAPFIDATKLQRVVAMTNATDPDLIVIAGDIFVQQVEGGSEIVPRIVADILSGLQAPLGVYAVLGNHDEGDQATLYLSELKRAGITPIDNDVRKVDVGALHFWIAGFADLETGGPDIGATLAKISDKAPVIALTHNPDLFPSVPARVNLLIAGHTHGGQVRLSFLSRKILRETRGGDIHYLSGHYRAQTDLFVTSGIGTTGLAVRFRVPPEIALLTLRQDSTR